MTDEAKENCRKGAIKRWEVMVMVQDRYITSTHELSLLTGIKTSYLNTQIRKYGYFRYKGCHYKARLL